SALEVAAFLESHPLVERVIYPGLKSHPQYELGASQMSGYSGLMSFIPRGNDQATVEMIRHLKYFELGPSWGGFESLINTPGVGISEEMSDATGIPLRLVRISIGLEKSASLMEDLDQALQTLRR